MRIAYVCADPGIPVFGTKGCSYHVQEVLRALIERGHEVDVFTLRVGGDCPEGLSAACVHALPYSLNADESQREQELLEANRLLRRQLKMKGPFDIVYERHALWAYAAMEYAKESGAIGIVELNAPLIAEQSLHRHLYDRVSAVRSTVRVLRSATSIVAVSDQVADYARLHGAAEDAIQIVPNGVRLERFATPSAVTTRAATTFTIGFVGSLRPWHAVDDLISAFAQMKSAEPFCPLRLRIVGQGPQRKSLEAQAASLSAPARTAIDFTGAIGYDTIPREMAEIDVSVAPYARGQSCYFSPLKLFEYMAAGLPLVAARTGQLAKIVRHRENGLLYAPGDIAALISALWELHDDKALRVRLGQAARSEVARHHTWHQRVDQILWATSAFQTAHSTMTTTSQLAT